LHLTRPTAAQRAQADALPAKRAQLLQQEGAPFAKRSSPKCPRLVSILASFPSSRLGRVDPESHFNEGSRQPFQTCVHPVGTRPVMTMWAGHDDVGGP